MSCQLLTSSPWGHLGSALKMLRHMIVMKTTGIVYYRQDFLRPCANVNMILQLMGAFLDAFSQALQHATPTYIEYKRLAVSVCLKDRGLAVVIFHDASDGPDFGHQVALSTMRAFLDRFPEPSAEQLGMMQREFAAVLPAIMRRAVDGLLENYVAQRVVLSAFIVHNDRNVPGGGAVCCVDGVDPLRIEAQWQGLAAAAEQTLALVDRNEAWESLSLECGHSRVSIVPITTEASLVAVYRPETAARAHHIIAHVADILGMMSPFLGHS